MLPQTQLPQIPDYVARNMQKIAETGMNDLNLREIGILLFDWEDKYGKDYGYENCRETVEWLSENWEHFYQIRDSFLKN